ncbi:H-NS histone family protein [Roseobacter sp. YSTF-M11]|uniref:H-NS histone family protein n=1 Tax=Roseobacter insulae TaxID=2859783 RepID=A0A9X1FW59_9RHOB|nr:H-NS histone family protein [Roseobacter insulae]MBW4709175.1 H-NS histone family protein [Roseobacter insulae]
MKFDLKTMSRKQLEKLRSDVDAALEKTIERERKAARIAVEKAAKAHGFTLAEIAADAKPAKTKRKVSTKAKATSPAKYANPEDKSQTWSGKGRQPVWFKTALASGKKAEQLLI